MNKDSVVKSSVELADKSVTVILGTNGDEGYPNIKAMLKMENDGIKTVWLSTNTSSKRVNQLIKDSRACLYFVDFESRKGLMLVGDIEILQDDQSKLRVWRDGFEKYYPLGVSDPDYTVLKFSSRYANYYHRGRNDTFEVL